MIYKSRGEESLLLAQSIFGEIGYSLYSPSDEVPYLSSPTSTPSPNQTVPDRSPQPDLEVNTKENATSKLLEVIHDLSNIVQMFQDQRGTQQDVIRMKTLGEIFHCEFTKTSKMFTRRKRQDPKKEKNETRVCTNCGTTSTPEWRRGPDGPRTLCNACGLKINKKVKRSPEKEDFVVGDLRNANMSSLSEFTNVAKATLKSATNHHSPPSLPVYEQLYQFNEDHLASESPNSYQTSVWLANQCQDRSHERVTTHYPEYVHSNDLSPVLVDSFGYPLNSGIPIASTPPLNDHNDDLLNYLNNVPIPTASDFRFAADEDDYGYGNFHRKNDSFYSNSLPFYTNN